MAWRRIPAVVVTAAILSAVGAATLPAAALGHGDQEVQSPAAARESDLRAVAEGNGWTVAQARAQDEAWREVARVNRRVSAERRDIYIGAALAETPGGAPTLYIKGPAPRFVRDLVAGARVPITIVDGQPYSFDELEQRKMRVHDALVDMGYEEVSTGFDITAAGRIDSAVLGTRGLPGDRASVLVKVPADLRPSVDVRVVDRSYGHGDNAIGGAKIWGTSAPAAFCTSGFSVEHESTGVRGVVSAGHCGGINRMHDSDPHILDLDAGEEHFGNWGDVEWYPTTSTEQAKFRASPTEVRDVIHREQVEDITVNRPLCLYGQQSDKKNCSLEVANPSRACSALGVTLNHMVLMNGDVGQGGDSGGPWYMNNTAVGVHRGACNTVFGDSFTPVDNLDLFHSLNVQVMIQE